MTNDEFIIRIDNLTNQLTNLNAGQDTATEYENLCVKIIDVLFQGHFYGWLPNDLDNNIKKFAQNSISDNSHRRDLIIPVNIGEIPDFWKFVSKTLGSRYITFKFKNYADRIKQGQIYTTEKYLYTKALRTVAILFTRKGANENAIKAIQGAIRENGKYMLVLEDSDVIEMLQITREGGDATDLLFTKLDDLLMKLPR